MSVTVEKETFNNIRVNDDLEEYVNGYWVKICNLNEVGLLYL